MHNAVMTQTITRAKIIEYLTVIATQTICSAKPQITVAVLGYGRNMIVYQSVCLSEADELLSVIPA